MLKEAGESIERFLDSGVTELGHKLGPLLWQFAPFKKFDEADFGGFLELLPDTFNGHHLRHVVEVRHDSFKTPEFIALLRKFKIAVVFTDHETYPNIADVTGDFVYARLQQGEDTIATAYPPKEIDALGRSAADLGGRQRAGRPAARRRKAKPKATPRDVFAYVIHEGKVRAPAAAMALIERLKDCARQSCHKVEIASNAQSPEALHHRLREGQARRGAGRTQARQGQAPDRYARGRSLAQAGLFQDASSPPRSTRTASPICICRSSARPTKAAGGARGQARHALAHLRQAPEDARRDRGDGRARVDREVRPDGVPAVLRARHARAATAAGSPRSCRSAPARASSISRRRCFERRYSAGWTTLKSRSTPLTRMATGGGADHEAERDDRDHTQHQIEAAAAMQERDHGDRRARDQIGDEVAHRIDTARATRRRCSGRSRSR